MSRAVMHTHAPAAEPVGMAALANYRFLITADGYASVEPASTENVYGVLWRISPSDRVTLDAWENIADGLYRAEAMAVEHAGHHHTALVYVAGTGKAGQARAGYMELVLAAALEWQLPRVYIASLQRWLPEPELGAAPGKLKDFRWT